MISSFVLAQHFGLQLQKFNQWYTFENLLHSPSLVFIFHKKDELKFLLSSENLLKIMASPFHISFRICEHLRENYSILPNAKLHFWSSFVENVLSTRILNLLCREKKEWTWSVLFFEQSFLCDFLYCNLQKTNNNERVSYKGRPDVMINNQKLLYCAHIKLLLTFII